MPLFTLIPIVMISVVLFEVPFSTSERFVALGEEDENPREARSNEIEPTTTYVK